MCTIHLTFACCYVRETHTHMNQIYVFFNGYEVICYQNYPSWRCRRSVSARPWEPWTDSAFVTPDSQFAIFAAKIGALPWRLAISSSPDSLAILEDFFCQNCQYVVQVWVKLDITVAFKPDDIPLLAFETLRLRPSNEPLPSSKN